MSAALITLVVLGAPLALLLLFRSGRRVIVTALIGTKHALILLGDRLGLRRLAAALTGRPRPAALTRPEVLRRVFEDLGPTYIKLGQIIASSPGLFSAPYVAAFRACLDRVPSFPYEEARRIVDEELGPEKAAELEMDPTPLASASIAQVHAARTAAGDDLVVKVQRPGIADRVDADVGIMRFGARVVALLSADARLANPVGVVEDFGATIREELDFSIEARNIEDFNEAMVELGHDRVRAPRVDGARSTGRVLTMERFYGYNVDDVEAVKASNLDAEEMLLLGLQAWFQCVMLRGLFHGDVHAGNLMWMEDGRIGFLDFGIVGRFDDQQRRQVTRYIMSFFTGNYRELAQVIVEMGGVKAKVDVDAFAKDLETAYGPMRNMAFGSMNYGEILPNILAMARKNQAYMPREFILIVKQVLYFDRYAKLLAPNLNLFRDPRIVSALAADVQRALATT